MKLTGTWTIIIEGHGINHNGTPKDADEMAKALVASLRDSGQAEVKGYFLYGPKLASSIVEPTMKRGTGWKMAEPLFPLCDQQIVIHHDAKTGIKHWGPCPRVATLGEIFQGELTCAMCEEHGGESLRAKHRSPVDGGVYLVDLSTQPVKA